MPRIPANTVKSKRQIEKEMNKQEKQIRQLEDAFYQKKELSKKESQMSLTNMHHHSPDKETKRVPKVKKERSGLSTENIKME